MEPNPNNGTIRLPLRPIGLHTDNDAPVLETPDDLPEHGPGPENLPTSSSSGAAKLASTLKNDAPAVATSEPDSASDKSEGEKQKSSSTSWWGWLTAKVDGAIDSIKGLFNGS
jgi:hypothetical protein